MSRGAARVSSMAHSFAHGTGMQKAERRRQNLEARPTARRVTRVVFSILHSAFCVLRSCAVRADHTTGKTRPNTLNATGLGR